MGYDLQVGHTLDNRFKILDVINRSGMASICEALNYMHSQGVVHRDLKPDNVMMCKDGRIKILDFGIAKTGLRRITISGFSSTLGTPDYMAPEQVKGQRGDARTDIYCLGAMMYEMLTGIVPFDGDNPFTIMNARLMGDPAAPRQVRPEIPPEVEEIVLKALERRPAYRYQSAAEMKAALDAPDKVKVTGRALRLSSPNKWRVLWSQYRTIVLSILTPIIVTALFFLFRKH